MGACMAAGLATSWLAAPGASAQTLGVHLNITDSSALDNAYFLYDFIGSSAVFAASLGNISAPGGSFNISLPSEDDLPLTIDEWDIVGSYTTDGITFGFKNPSDAVGQSYDSVLGVENTEANDYALLLGGNAILWDDFASGALNYGAADLGQSVTLVNFSNGTEVGTATATVPEPMSASVMCLGGAVLMSRRRRRIAG